MTDTYNGTKRAVILWLSGLQLTDLLELPEVEALAKRGVQVELDPLPITGPRGQHLQVLSGRSPSSFGFFDTLVPQNYVIQEQTTGRGDMPKLLPDILRSVGWHVEYKETPLADFASSVHQWTQTVPSQAACLILKCSVEDIWKREIMLPTLARTLNDALAWVGETGLLAVLSDWHPAAVKRFVNLNNYLAEMGVIERVQDSLTIDWLNSLAYFAGHGQLWLNLLGRDAQGIVHPQGEAEEVCETLIKALPAKLLDPQTGEAIIEHIFRREELYAGNYLFYAPELVVQFAPGYAPSPRSQAIDFDDAIFTMPAAGALVGAGVHPSQVRGFLLASSHALATAVRVTERVPLTAVAPTLLHALDIEYSGLEEGPVASLFDPVYLAEHPIKSGTEDQGLSDEDEELIINRLRDLGYV